MISPIELLGNPLFGFHTRVPLLALLLYVDEKGQAQDRDGCIGEVLDVTATQVSEGAVWIIETGYHTGDVVQAFMHFDHAEVFGDESRISYDPHGRTPRSVGIVVTGFAANMAGVFRATDHATIRILSDMDAFHGLLALSDDALEHALDTNLKTSVSLQQHRENIAELEELVRSDGELAGEIRAFLESLKNPKDRRKRHNTYRMVLIIRAVQRRATKLGGQKSDALEAITQVRLDVGRYIGATVATSSRMHSELMDRQPWWLGIRDGLPPGVSERRARNFLDRLLRFKWELDAMGANPFRPWAQRAAQDLEGMIHGFQREQYALIPRDALRVAASLKMILAREQLSRAVLAARRDEHIDDAAAALSACNDAVVWSTPTLGITDRFDAVMHAVQEAKRVLETEGCTAALPNLRAVEAAFDAIRP